MRFNTPSSLPDEALQADFSPIHTAGDGENVAMQDLTPKNDARDQEEDAGRRCVPGRQQRPDAGRREAAAHGIEALGHAPLHGHGAAAEPRRRGKAFGGVIERSPAGCGESVSDEFKNPFSTDPPPPGLPNSKTRTKDNIPDHSQTKVRKILDTTSNRSDKPNDMA